MRPLLAIVPQLPLQFFVPLAGLTVVVALALAVRNTLQLRQVATTPGGSVGRAAQPTLEEARAMALMPLGLALALCFALFIWSRQEIKLHSYGFFLVLGFFAGTWNACLEAKRRGYDPNLILDMALPMLAVTVLMCRLLFVALDWQQFHSPWEVLQVWSGGLSFHGAIIGGAMVGAYYSWTRKISLGRLLDLMAPSVFLGYFFGRLGCFFNGCCYGEVCNLPWAVRFPDEAHPGLLTPPSHPTQLYSAALALLLFFFMQYAKKLPAFNRFPGQPTLLFLVLYSLERGFVEIFRNGATASTVLGTTWLTQAQFVSIISLVAIAILWAVLLRRASSDPNLSHAVPNSQPPATTA